MTDETLFATALEKPDPAARAAYLASTCPDPETRRRIDALLAAHDKAGGFLERPVVAPPDPEVAATKAFAPDPGADHTRTHGGTADTDTDEALGFLAPPRRPDSLGRIGHYEVLEVLGRGGFGIVFRAFDDVLQRVVAVKVLAPSMAVTSPARKRFLREARSSAQVRHENVVQVFSVEEAPLPYLVMEFIPGETLQQRLDRTGPLDVPEILRIGRQVAAGLAAAHETGLIHRDIKPSNILIDKGPQERVKITDFGLARAADDASISQSGVVAGTPMYMAPEQAKGDTLDHRADLFSLGSVLYVMCSGRPPFRASGTLAVLKRVCEEDPRPIREVIPEVPEWLCRVIEKLHAKDPADRFQTAKEVTEVLADCEKQLTAHATLTDFSRIPEAKPLAKSRYRGFAIALCLVAALFWCAALFAEPAFWYATNRGVVEFKSDPDVLGYDLLPGVLSDGPALQPVTGGTHPALRLSPGAYRIEAKCNPGRVVERWEVTTHGLFANRTQEHSGASLMLAVGRGEQLTVQPILGDAPPVPDSPKSADGFVSLFNGKDLTGWQGRADKYFVTKAGSLLANPVPNEYGMLRTVKSYENYELRLQSRVDGEGNPASKAHAGVALHVTDVAGRTGPTYGAYIWLNAGRAPDMQARGIGDVGEVQLFEKTKGPSAGTWNELRVVCRGQRITVFYNGEERWSCNRCSIGKGQIGLWTEEGDAHFRNIEIRELPAAQPGDVFVSLFNGKDLAGWSGKFPEAWSVENGVLIGRGKRGSVEGWSELIHARNDFQDFHLRARARINASGWASLRVRKQQASLKGYKVWLSNDPDNTGARTGRLDVDGDNLKVMNPPDDLKLPVDQWFTLDLTARGPELVLSINGQEAARVTDSSFDRGEIQLEVAGADTVVQFQNIEIREAPAKSAPPPAIAPFDAAKATAHQKDWAKHLGVEVETTNSIGMKLRLIPPGEFMMGSTPDDIAEGLKELTKHGKSGWFFEFVEARSGPQRAVRLTKPYYLGAHEVTVGDFSRFVKDTGYRTLAEKNAGKPYWAKPGWKDAPDPRHPVTFIAWPDAQAFCDWLSQREGRTYRLPTEAEWEFACRAGTTTRWSWGNDRDQFLRHAWFSQPINGGLARVGEKLPNAFGLYDMHGNAEEWCADWHHSMLTVAPENPHRTEQKDATGRVVRGGFGFDVPELGRSGRRSFAAPDNTTGLALGFRVAVVGDPKAKPEAAPAPRAKP